MTDVDAPGEATLVDRFYGRFEADRAAGVLRPLAEYLAEFPGQELVVASAFCAYFDPHAPGKPRAETSSPLFADRYEIRRELGRGGQGAVYEAYDTRVRRPVALKVLLRRVGRADPGWIRFRREAEVASRLEDPGVCPVYDVGQDRGSPYIAMRLVDGETLSKRIANRRRGGAGPPPRADGDVAASSSATPPTVAETVAAPAPPRRAEIPELLRLVERTARTLHAAHEAGVVHRDVKPGNVVVAKDGTPVVLDFGLARDDASEDGGLTATGEALGTPAYMAPEQLRGAHVDRRADVWALGVTLFELLTLRRPFEGATRDALSKAVREAEPPRLRDLNPEAAGDVEIVVSTALEKSPDGRYATALDLAEDLRRIRERLPIRARPAGPLTRVRRFVERRPGVAVAALAVLVSLGGGLVVSLQALSEKASAVVEYERLADVKLLRDLLAESADLRPSYPEVAPALEDWLGRAEPLANALPRHEADLAALTERFARAASRPRRGEEDDEAARAARWRFETLGGLVADLRRFVDPDPAKGAVAAVRERLAAARTVVPATLEGPAAESWRVAVGEIADRALCPRYGGLKIVPRAGLVPLRRDRNSGLYEFWAPQTGARPALDAEGRLAPAADDAVVFVLVPGGAHHVGDWSDDDARPDDERPSRADLAPFFVGKFEVTRAQWRRFFGDDRAIAMPDESPDAAERDRLPVTDRTWNEAAEYARRAGFALPTSEQWEAACRGGRATRFAFGDDEEDLEGRANVADARLLGQRGASTAVLTADWDDGRAWLAPVDAYEPNGYGLYGVHGNAAEWCVDRIGGENDALARRLAKGGSFLQPPAEARVARRLLYSAEARSTSLGLRLSAPLTRE
jgi:serine/threonine protein kinase/formylglycine-generating enzyme required for sulfatase activity